LLNLPEDVLEDYNAGKLAYTKAIELGRIEDDTTRKELLTETVNQGLTLSELKKRIRPAASRTVITKMESLRTQVEALNSKSIQRLSSEQRHQLKESIDSLANLLREKRQELERLEE
jgi:ParB family chromosome partitioning protein